MDKLTQSMDTLYYQNIETQASKNKIKVVLPKLNQATETPFIANNAPTDSITETETMYSDEYIYRKPWNKLNSIHKIIKIKEFISNLESDDIDMKKKLKIKLVDMIKNKQLTKKTDINYDSTNGNIISIPILQYKESKYMI
jgi:hypothetical protein